MARAVRSEREFSTFDRVVADAAKKGIPAYKVKYINRGNAIKCASCGQPSGAGRTLVREKATLLHPNGTNLYWCFRGCEVQDKSVKRHQRRASRQELRTTIQRQQQAARSEDRLQRYRLSLGRKPQRGYRSRD